MNFKKSFYRGLYASLEWWQFEADLVWYPHPVDGLVADATIAFYRTYGGGENKTEIYSVKTQVRRIVENGILCTDADRLSEEIENMVSHDGTIFDCEDKSILLQITGSFLKLVKETLRYSEPVVRDIIDYYSMVMS